MTRPRIGVTVDRDNDERTVRERTVQRRVRDEGAYFLYAAYVDAVEHAGGLPLLLPHIQDDDGVAAILDALDGLLVTGGDFDIAPSAYGEAPSSELGRISNSRTKSEQALLMAALERTMPVLAICGGEQLLNVVRGGTLLQDIPSERPDALPHEQTTPKTETSHEVALIDGSLLADVLGGDGLAVNSTHHQAVKEIGTGLRINAVAPDGVIEGVEVIEHAFALGVQWHPELLAGDDPRQRRLFEAFIEACRA